MRSFKPALARDYDVFFAAIGLLCGGILFFQGWRLDPILQFGQFLLAGTTVFFAYESVRLRGVATDQARRSSYFDEESGSPRMPSGGLRGGWDDSFDQFGESQPVRRRFSGQESDSSDRLEEDLYRPRRVSRAAIPEEAASRRRRSIRNEDSDWNQESEQSRRMDRFSQNDPEQNSRSTFGERRNLREDQRRGTRPLANDQTSSTRVRKNVDSTITDRMGSSSSRRPGVPKGTPVQTEAEDVAFSPSRSNPSKASLNRSSASDGSYTYSSETRSARPRSRSSRPSSRTRDNSSRFDD